MLLINSLAFILKIHKWSEGCAFIVCTQVHFCFRSLATSGVKDRHTFEFTASLEARQCTRQLASCVCVCVYIVCLWISEAASLCAFQCVCRSGWCWRWHLSGRKISTLVFVYWRMLTPAIYGHVINIPVWSGALRINSMILNY